MDSVQQLRRTDFRKRDAKAQKSSRNQFGPFTTSFAGAAHRFVMAVTVHAASLANNRYGFTNLGYLSPAEFDALGGDPTRSLSVFVNAAVINVKAREDVKPGIIELSLFQRRAANVTFDDDIVLTPVIAEPTQYISSISFGLDVLVKGKLTTAVKVDSGKLAEFIAKEFAGQMFKRGQEFCCDFEGMPLKLAVSDFSYVTLPEGGAAASSRTDSRLSNFGLFVRSSAVTFEKAKDAPIEISGGTKYARACWQRPQLDPTPSFRAGRRTGYLTLASVSRSWASAVWTRSSRTSSGARLRPVCTPA